MSAYGEILKSLATCRDAGLSDEATAAILMTDMQDAPLPDRLALARALVPEYVVAKVPAAKRGDGDLSAYSQGREAGFNACRAEVIKSGEEGV